MEWIIGLAVFAAVILLIVYLTKSGGKLIAERQERISRSEKGKAKILGFSTIGFAGTANAGGFQAYKFTLEVSSAYKAPYNAETVWNVFPMGIPKVQVGNEVDVKIDVDDPSIIYPDIQAVEYSWSAAEFERVRKKKQALAK